MVGVTSICKDILSEKKLYIDTLKIHISDQAQDVIKILSDLHVIHPMLNGCVMEAMVAFAYKHDFYNIPGKSYDEYYDICCEIICKRSSYEFEPFYVNAFRDAIMRNALGIIDLYSNKFPPSYIIFYIIAYLIANNWDCEKWLTIEVLSDYITKFLDNIVLIRNYIDSIKKLVGDKINFCVPCDFNSIGLYEINGKCDMVSDDWLIEIKCSESYAIKEWFKQLEVYNLVMKKRNIGVINLLTNEFIIYHNMGQITKEDIDMDHPILRWI